MGAQDDGFGFFAAGSSSDDVPAERLVELARDPDPSVRFAVAADERMPVEGLRLLALDHDPGIRASVLSNCLVPTAVLAAMLERFPEDRPHIATHPQAPLAVMEAAPLTHHTFLSLRSFLTRQGATRAQQEHVLSLHGTHETALLGVVWAAARAMGRRRQAT